MREIIISIVFGDIYSKKDPVHLEMHVKSIKVNCPKSESLIRCQLEAIIKAENWANEILSATNDLDCHFTVHIGDLQKPDKKIINLIAWDFKKDGPNVPFYIDRRSYLQRLVTKGSVFDGMKKAKEYIKDLTENDISMIEWKIW